MKTLVSLVFFAAYLNALFQPKRSRNFGILWVREKPVCLAGGLSGLAGELVHLGLDRIHP